MNQLLGFVVMRHLSFDLGLVAIAASAATVALVICAQLP
jgi:hypothetical protein